MSFEGKILTLQVFHPTLSSPISQRIDAVVGDGVEFEDIKKFELGSGNVVNVDIDGSAQQIAYRIDQAPSRFATTPGFNGYKFSDEFDSIDPIVGVQIQQGPNALRLSPDAVFFSENGIFVDVDGLSFQRGQTIDLVVTFGDASAAGQIVPIALQSVARLYAASFGRRPDDSGLTYWINKYQGGDDLGTIAAHFYFSAEFAKLFGAPSSLTDQELVDVLYRNILSRPGETGGVNFWLEKLASGYARSNLLIDFATSAENLAMTSYAEDLAKNLAGTDWIVT